MKYCFLVGIVHEILLPSWNSLWDSKYSLVDREVILQVTLFRPDHFHTMTYFTSIFIPSGPISHHDLFFYSHFIPSGPISHQDIFYQ